MNKLQVVIIEDEVPAARLLHLMVVRLRPDWEITVLPGSVDEAVAWFGEHPHPDIIFWIYSWLMGMPLISYRSFIRNLSLFLLRPTTSTPFAHLPSTVLIIS